jgi:hypothetical protein
MEQGYSLIIGVRSVFMKLTILLMALWFIVPVFAAGPNPTNVRERVIADMENYRTNVLERGQIGVFDAKDDECADVAKASISLAISEADPEVRGRLVRTTFRCAKRSRRAAQTTWYTNDAVIMPLIEYYGKYETHDISDSLIELVSPRWLNQQRSKGDRETASVRSKGDRETASGCS